MIFEGVTGGKCHNCGYDRCELRFGTGGWFQFEACPRCGFGFGNSFDGSGFAPFLACGRRASLSVGKDRESGGNPRRRLFGRRFKLRARRTDFSITGKRPPPRAPAPLGCSCRASFSFQMIYFYWPQRGDIDCLSWDPE